MPSYASEQASRREPWNLVALVLAGAGVCAATWLVVGSDGDPTQVVWPAVVAPIAIALVPVLAPRHGARLAAVVALAGWCFVTGFTIGFLLLPALGALVAALVLEER